MKLISFLGSCIFEKLYNTFGLVLKYATRMDKLDILVAFKLIFKTNQTAAKGEPPQL